MKKVRIHNSCANLFANIINEKRIFKYQYRFLEVWFYSCCTESAKGCEPA